MSRLIAYIGNDADRVACALHAARAALVVDGAEPVDGPKIDSWGIGFYQGEILLQRRPKAPAQPIDFYEAARGLRTDVIVAHARAGTVGKPKHENTHPFRFRSWLFAHHGTLPDFEARRADVLATVPDFLARNIRGQTDSEALFHLVLAELHRAQKLDDLTVSPQVMRDAVAGALGTCARVLGAEATKSMECALALTNGRTLLVSRRGSPLFLLEQGAIHDCPVCRDTATALARRDRRIDHEHLRALVCVGGLPSAPTGAPWRELPNDHAVTVSHDVRPDVRALSV
jgi:glutamine amidotransferase